MTDFTSYDVSKGEREKCTYETLVLTKIGHITIEISLDDLITKLVQNIHATSFVSLTIV